MISATETTDHDANLPPVHVGDVGHLAQVLLDNRWATMSPGDLIATYLVGEGARHGPQ